MVGCLAWSNVHKVAAHETDDAGCVDVRVSKRHLMLRLRATRYLHSSVPGKSAAKLTILSVKLSENTKKNVHYNLQSSKTSMSNS